MQGTCSGPHQQLTIWASGLEFLAKCFLPLPEKWHGLSDVETRYRQRYLDLIVNPESRRVFEVRSRVLAATRAFLNGRGYLEVETPMMQPIAGGALASVRDPSQALDCSVCARAELYRTPDPAARGVYRSPYFRHEGIRPSTTLSSRSVVLQSYAIPA